MNNSTSTLCIALAFIVSSSQAADQSKKREIWDVCVPAIYQTLKQPNCYYRQEGCGFKQGELDFELLHIGKGQYGRNYTILASTYSSPFEKKVSYRTKVTCELSAKGSVIDVVMVD